MRKSKIREYFEMSEQDFSKLTKNELSEINKFITTQFRKRLTGLLNTEGGKYSPALNSLYRIASGEKEPAYQKYIAEIQRDINLFITRERNTLNKERAYFAQMRQYLFEDVTFSKKGWKTVYEDMQARLGSTNLSYSKTVDFWKAYDKILASDRSAAMINYRENLAGVISYKAVWEDIATYLEDGESVDNIVAKMNEKIGREYEKTREAEYESTLPPFITKRKV